MGSRAEVRPSGRPPSLPVYSLVRSRQAENSPSSKKLLGGLRQLGLTSPSSPRS